MRPPPRSPPGFPTGRHWLCPACSSPCCRFSFTCITAIVSASLALSPLLRFFSLHFPALRGRVLAVNASLSGCRHVSWVCFAASGALCGVRTLKVLHKQVLNQLLSISPELSRLGTEPGQPSAWRVNSGKVACPRTHHHVMGGSAGGVTFSRRDSFFKLSAACHTGLLFVSTSLSLNGNKTVAYSRQSRATGRRLLLPF